jgi:hypothetical protein
MAVTADPAATSRSAPAPTRSCLRRCWLLTFGAFVVLGLIWSLAQPLLSTADEGQHFLDAEAVWHGQVFPRLVAGPGPMDDAVLHVRNLGAASGSKDGFRCFNYDLDRSAACYTATVQVTKRPVDSLSYLAREPILPGLLTGLPIALDPSAFTLYVGRFLDTLLSAAVLATAITMALRRGRRLMVLGVVVAFTPCAVAETGAFGSSPVEVAAALLAWTAAALLLDGEPMTGPFAVLCGVAGVGLALARPLSPAWLAVLVAAVLVARFGRGRLRALARPGSARIVIGVTALASLVAAWWALSIEAPISPNDHVVRTQHIPATLGGRLHLLRITLWHVWRELVGATGGSYVGPRWMTFTWIVLIAVVVIAGFVIARARGRLVIALIAVCFLGISNIFKLVEMPTLGLFWHGRYDLPTLIGLMIVPCMLIEQRLGHRRGVTAAGAAIVAVAAALQIVDYYGALHRFAVGDAGAWAFWQWTTGWHPPVPLTLLLVAGPLALVATYAWLTTLLREPSLPGSAGTDSTRTDSTRTDSTGTDSTRTGVARTGIAPAHAISPAETAVAARPGPLRRRPRRLGG